MAPDHPLLYFCSLFFADSLGVDPLFFILRLPYIVKILAILKFISSNISMCLYLLYVDIDGDQRGFALVQSANKAKICNKAKYK